jgi:hypothetical protein
MSVLLVGPGDSAAAQGVGEKGGQAIRVVDGEPDTASPNWKQLSQDVGILIRKDEGLGLRGRLFVRVNGAWLPVAADGLADVLGHVPVR